MDPVQKICVTGKGGAGKSTISSIIARIFEKKGYEVLIMDTDESNPGLFRKLGMSNEPVPLISYLERFNLEYGIPENTWLSKDEIRIQDIPKEFIVKKGNISLIEIGKINHSLQGCACSMADLSKQLMKNLKLEEKQIVIADLEAGVESFGRGIEKGADTIIAITETSYDLMNLAERIKEMSNDMGIKRVFTIYNRIPENLSSAINNSPGENDMDILGTLEYESDVMESGFLGKPVPDDTVLFRNVNNMLDEILAV